MMIETLKNRIKARDKEAFALGCLVTFFFLFLIMAIFFGERVPINNGQGWDGILYSKYAKNFYAVMVNHDLSAYYAQRIFPSFLLYSAGKLFHFSIADVNLPFLFSMLNAIMLSISVLIWTKIAKKYGWSLPVKIISFAALFFNFANLKLCFYYPILCDTTAFTLGFLMLYYYLEEKAIPLVLVTVAGAFTYPTLIFIGLLLTVFPKTPKKALKRFILPYSFWIAVAFAAVISLASLSLIVFGFSDVRIAAANYIRPILLMSFLLLFLYLAASFAPLVNSYWNFLLNIKKLISWPKVMLALCIFLAVKLAINLIASATLEQELTFALYIRHIAGQALAYPFVFLVSHFMYFGPIICLVVFWWREMVQYMEDNKLYILLVIIGTGLLFGMGSESRQFINYLPLLVFLVAEVINKKQLNPTFVTIFVGLSLFISRCWLTINQAEWPESMDTFLEFPLQWHFMNFGPWLSKKVFIVYLLLLLFSLRLLYYFARDSIKPLIKVKI